jgi:hypothetical protein
MRVMYAKAVSQRIPVVHPVTIRTTWRALTNQRVIKRLKEEWQDWTHNAGH